MIAMLLLTVFGLGAFCMLLFRCAVYALPVMVGLSTGYWAITSGAGIVGGALVGLVVGGLVFGLGQAALRAALRCCGSWLWGYLQRLRRWWATA